MQRRVYQMNPVQDADPQSHERFGEIDHLLSLWGDGEAGDRQVSFLQGERVRDRHKEQCHLKGPVSSEEAQRGAKGLDFCTSSKLLQAQLHVCWSFGDTTIWQHHKGCVSKDALEHCNFDDIYEVNSHLVSPNQMEVWHSQQSAIFMALTWYQPNNSLTAKT